MTPRRITVFVVFAAGVLAATSWLLRDGQGANESTAPAPRPSPAHAVEPDPQAPPRRSGAATPDEKTPAPTGPDYAAQLRAAADYLDFARALLPAARANDHAAQFYIYRALDYCGDGYRAYFDRGGVRRTLDDAMQWAATRPPPDPEEIRRLYGRCRTLMESGTNDLGEGMQWLNLAAQGSYPRAQARLAREIQAGRGSPPPADPSEVRERVRELAGAALRSRDPEVIWEMINIGLPDDSVAWMIAACRRGMDCGPQADYVKWICSYDRNCQPYENLIDIIQRQQADEFPEIEARARSISEKIDAGDWEALGF